MSDRDDYNRAMDYAQDVVDAFKNGIQAQYDLPEPVQSTLCPEIQTYLYGRAFSFSDPAERKAFNDAGGHDPSGCPQVCAIAAAVAAWKILGLREKQP